MKFHYRAVTKNSKLVQGLMEAKDSGEIANYLRAKELTPVAIEEDRGDYISKLSSAFHQVKTNDVVMFTRQISSMLSAGLTLLRALEIFKDQVQNPAMMEVLDGVVSQVENGKPFSAAISKYPKVFSGIYVSLIKAGEKSGLLDKVLLRLADNMEKQQKLRSTIKGALMYPIIIVILMVVVVGVMMIFVIPQLTVLYKNLNIELPLPTKIVMGLSDITIKFWPITLGAIALLFVAYQKWSKTEDGRLIIDNLKLKMPVFGKLIKQTILAEFTRTFGLLVGTGTLVVEALTETADTAGNVYYKNAIADVAKQVEKGVSIGDAMAYYPLFTPMLVQLVKIGEQTGKVDETLLKASEYFEREVDQSVKTLTTAMEPFIMVILGIGVSFLIISVITPIYSLISSIQ
jgi:type IV pilus assembly protein PilC